MKATGIQYQLVAFLVPLFVRFIPEVLAYPYPVGFDTVAYYVPIVLSRIALVAGLGDYLGGTILLYLPLTLAYLVVGDALLIMKFVPPMLLGFFGWSAYLLGRKSLRLNAPWALAFALLVSIYFVTLRLSWDLHRNTLGLSFVLLTLACMQERSAAVRFGATSLLAALSVLAHESSAALIAIVSAVHLISDHKFRRLEGWVPFVPALLLIIWQFVSGRDWASQVQGPALEPNPIAAFAFNLGFLVLSFGLLLPVALFGVGRSFDRRLAVWAFVSLFFGLIPNFGVPTGAPHRWAMLLTVPVMASFVNGIQTLNSAKYVSYRRLGRVATGLSLVAIAVISSGYLGLHGASQFYISFAPEYLPLMPKSMVESTIAIDDIPSVFAIARWALAKLNRASVLILPFQLYAWYLAAASERERVTLHGFGGGGNVDDLIANIKPETGPDLLYARSVDLYRPGSVVLLARLALEIANARRDVYVVWWGDASLAGSLGRLPSNFSLATASGRFGVFSTNQT